MARACCELLACCWNNCDRCKDAQFAFGSPAAALSWGHAGRAGAAAELSPETGAPARAYCACLQSAVEGVHATVLQNFPAAALLLEQAHGQPACSLCSWGSTPTACMLCSVNVLYACRVAGLTVMGGSLVLTGADEVCSCATAARTLTTHRLGSCGAHTVWYPVCRLAWAPAALQRPTCEASGKDGRRQPVWDDMGSAGAAWEVLRVAATQGQGRAAAPPARAGLRAAAGCGSRHGVVRAALRESGLLGAGPAAAGVVCTATGPQECQAPGHVRTRGSFGNFGPWQGRH